MRIAILGSGNVGSGLAAASTAAGHDVVLTAADPANAEKVAGAVGARSAPSNRQAVADADVVVLAIPHAAVAAVADELSGALAGKVVIDATNPLNATYSDLTTTGVSAAEQLQQQLPATAVVKALNTVFAGRYADPATAGEPLDAFLAGDDTAAKATVADLVASLGYRVIDTGSLRMARSLEEMAFLNISLNAANGWPFRTAWKLVGATESP